MGCFNSTVVNAPADKVWNTIRNFHDMSWAAGVVEKVDKVGSLEGDQLGAKRVLNGVFHETLLALDDVSRELKYSIDDGQGTPVAKGAVIGYVGHIRLVPVTDTKQTCVVWTSGWEAGSNEIAGFCNTIYAAALGALKKHFGG